MNTFRFWMFVRHVGTGVILLLFAGMLVAAVAQVVSRYIFNSPLTWSEELSRYLFIWLSFLGAWVAWNRREHLGIDVLPELVPPHWRGPLMRLLEILTLIFAVTSMYFGQKILSVSMRQPSAALRIPMVWVYSSYYVGMTLISAEILLGWLYTRIHPTSEVQQ